MRFLASFNRISPIIAAGLMGLIVAYVGFAIIQTWDREIRIELAERV